MMKNILCFGDSNTWGYNPVTKKDIQRKSDGQADLITYKNNGCKVCGENADIKDVSKNKTSYLRRHCSIG